MGVPNFTKANEMVPMIDVNDAAERLLIASRMKLTRYAATRTKIAMALVRRFDLTQLMQLRLLVREPYARRVVDEALRVTQEPD